MKMEDLIEKQSKKGTYAGVRFSNDTKKSINEFIKANNIPNGLKSESLHSTLLYSRTHLPDYAPAGNYDPILVGSPTKMEKWPSQPDSNGKVSMCLVLKYDCPQLCERHKSLMDEHNGTYDFDEYKTHLTLSYNVGGLQVKDLPKFEDDIEIIKEYGSDLDLNWAEKQ